MQTTEYYTEFNMKKIQKLLPLILKTSSLKVFRLVLHRNVVPYNDNNDTMKVRSNEVFEGSLYHRHTQYKEISSLLFSIDLLLLSSW